MVLAPLLPCVLTIREESGTPVVCCEMSLPTVQSLIRWIFSRVFLERWRRNPANQWIYHDSSYSYLFVNIHKFEYIYTYINKCVRVKEEKVSMSTSARLIQMLERDDHQLVGPWCLQGRNNLGNCFRIFHACSIWYSTDWRLNCSFWKFVDATRFISFAPV